MRKPLSPLLIACAIIAVSLLVAAAQTPTGKGPQPQSDLTPDFAIVGKELARVEAEVDSTYADALAEAAKIPNDQSHRVQQIRALGKIMLFDKRLSANQNTACASCHMPYSGFTGPISELNRTTVAYPGSVRDADATFANSRYGNRKPQSYSYAPLYPPLQYNVTQQDFYGGNFWDLRATGDRLQNAAAEQAQGPMLDADEHALIDSACVVYRISKSPYRKLFETVWGPQAFDIKWPSDIEQVCGRPGPPSPDDPLPVHLSPEDRGRSNTTFDQFALSIAAFEAYPEITPFTSKFDYAIAHPDQEVLNKDELAGWALFRGKAMCNTCHLDGTSNGQDKVTPADVASKAPVFTDFTSANIGVPKNPANPFYHENKPDKYGFVPNPKGAAFVDMGVGGFLRGAKDPNADWVKYADRYDGRFQVPTLRNVDMRPYPSFVKAYTHNGYFKSLKEIVHFYNTRDKLPRCEPGATGEKVTCWPAPEVAANMDTTVGNLRLTDAEENQIVAFLKTLTDGYKAK